MKKLTAGILVLIMMLGMALTLASCSKSKEAAVEEPETEEAAAAEDNEESEAPEDSKTEDIVKTIEPDAEDVIGHDLPMQISRVTLYRDGSIRVDITDDLKKNELGDSEASSLMPFAESGQVSDIYLMRIGNGGYRTLVALMDDGTVSAVNTRALIEDHIITVKDNLGGRDSFTAVEQLESEDGYGIIGKTEEGDDIVLDPLILEEEGDVQPAE